ncbi:MAG: M20/M25/M40 family metallo-hydrolase [Firmicutes bacterium]|nr:M20/M25/M40 family metallo-hydrolase [Bacillota bacterium]
MELHIDAERLLEDFRALHAMPEPGFHEYRTTEYLRKRLAEEGFELLPLTETGALALADSGLPGPSYALRADIDALSFLDAEGKTYYKHACGHDSHAAMLLAAGTALKKAGIPGRGRLYLLFQPAEETLQGAAAVLKAGLPPLDGMIGMHIRPEYELAEGKAAPELRHGAALPTNVRFTGKGAHGARPFLGRNALSAAALAVTMVDALAKGSEEYGLPEADYSASEGRAMELPWSAKATVCSTPGGVHNLIPERVELTFDLRAKDNVLVAALTTAVDDICAKAASRFGCEAEISRLKGYAADYDPALSAVCEEAIREVFGETSPSFSTVGSEDFHIYHAEGGIPTAYMALGSDLKPGLHARDMSFSPSCLPAGAELFYRVAEKLLG